MKSSVAKRGDLVASKRGVRTLLRKFPLLTISRNNEGFTNTDFHEGGVFKIGIVIEVASADFLEYRVVSSTGKTGWINSDRVEKVNND